jgi:nitroimidazol reductase NimA-like FMN-containing flavoprotein (pyridoxamine 5'-phosphate oxidase superfamily)
MWIDDRGSEVVPISECRRLLAIGAKMRFHGHLGISKEGAPLVLPLDYVADGSDVIIRVGDQIVRHIDGELVAFQVDNAAYEQATDGNGTEGTWSVLVRGLVTGWPEPPEGVDLPHPRVAEPGHRLLRIRGDVITGRRLRRSGEADQAAP